MCHTATIRLCTTDKDIEEALKRVTDHMPRGGLSVTVVLGEAITDLRDDFMNGYRGIQDGREWFKLEGQDWHVLGRIDLRRTSLRRIGSEFLHNCKSLTTVTLPPSLTEVGERFLWGCSSLPRVDMGQTALHTIGERFAYYCRSLAVGNGNNQ